MTQVLPGSPVPVLDIKLLDGSSWLLSSQKPANFTMLVIFRNSHCSICHGYLKQLNDLVDNFTDVGVNILAVSVDSASRITEMATKLSLGKLTLGCELSVDIDEKWGLFTSAKRKESEPDQFFEPALFLIDATGKLYYVSIQSMPFGRTAPSEILKWIPKIINNDIPARGEATQ
ncbi:MAG: redoxin domain-containing protein [Parasphingorhabdus sp.]